MIKDQIHLGCVVGTTFKRTKKLKTVKGFEMCNTKEIHPDVELKIRFYSCQQIDPLDKNKYLMILYPNDNNLQMKDLNYQAILYIRKLQVPQLPKIYDYGFFKHEKFMVIDNFDCFLYNHIQSQMEIINNMNPIDKAKEIVQIIQDLAMQLGECLRMLQQQKIALCNLNEILIGVKYITKEMTNETTKETIKQTTIIYKIIDFSQAMYFVDQKNSSNVSMQQLDNLYFQQDFASLGNILKNINYYLTIGMIPNYTVGESEKLKKLSDNNDLRDFIELMTTNDQQLSFERIFRHSFLKEVYHKIFFVQRVFKWYDNVIDLQDLLELINPVPITLKKF